MTKKLFLLLAIVALLCAMTIPVCNYIIVRYAEGKCFDDINAVPYNRVALVLGTSAKLSNGEDNQYFTNRISASADLYHSGKVDFFVLSGDNRKTGYNEPEDMKHVLVAAGVPEDRIYLDYAGFRTLDSVVRMHRIFGQSSFTVVSQKFHNERALYLASFHGLNAVGYNADDVHRYFGFKTRCREYLARVKMFLDIISGKEPYFGGEPVEIR